ncbi:MAG: UDP-glucose 4-epimerase GalE, partial [Balneolaceae bacterium]
SNYSVIGIDNLVNSSEKVLERITELTNKQILFEQIDLRDKDKLSQFFENNAINAVIHFAGFKAVGESVENPLLYFSNNIKATITLLEVMAQFNVKELVFSSSCTVYGDPQDVPLTENSLLSPTNPYGRTKYWIEKMLLDIYDADSNWSIISLRYFNPIGAHPSGLIGENPIGIPNNLVPFITQTVIGKRKKLSIFGDTYPTHDGTCVRDYIHVCDLSLGHVAALKKLKGFNKIDYYNLGTGKGHSVLDVVQTFERVNQVKVPFEIDEKRPGDAAEVWAETARAKEELKWEALLTLEDMLRDAWNWQVKNPEGIY